MEVMDMEAMAAMVAMVATAVTTGPMAMEDMAGVERRGKLSLLRKRILKLRLMLTMVHMAMV